MCIRIKYSNQHFEIVSLLYTKFYYNRKEWCVVYTVFHLTIRKEKKMLDPCPHRLAAVATASQRNFFFFLFF